MDGKTNSIKSKRAVIAAPVCVAVVLVPAAVKLDAAKLVVASVLVELELELVG